MVLCIAVCAVAGGGAAADGAKADGDGAGDDAAEQEEKTEVQADPNFITLHSEPVVLLISDKGPDGQFSWQSRGKCTLSFKQARTAGKKLYITVSSGVSADMGCGPLRPVCGAAHFMF